MNGRNLTDAQISKALRAHLPDLADPGLRERTLADVEGTRQEGRPPTLLGRVMDADPEARRRAMLVLAAALVTLGLVAAGVGSALLRERPEPRRDLSLIPSPIPSTALQASLHPSPSPTAGPLIWTTESLREDWPAPVRIEPAGPPNVVPMLSKTPDWTGRYVDPTGDTGTDVVPWVDIIDVTIQCSSCLGLGLVAEGPAEVDPTEQWIAYGIVADTDRDGVADWRYGTDNTPVGTPGTRGWPRRWWRTDLHTGRTEMYLGDNIALPSGTYFYGGPPSRFSFGGDFTGRGTDGGGTFSDRPERFYVWASVIQDGRVLATDYAPDAGWLQPSPGAAPT